MPSPKIVSQLGFIVWYLRNEFNQALLWGWGWGSQGKGERIAESTAVSIDITQHPCWSLRVSCCFGPVLLSLSRPTEQLRLACTPPSLHTQLSLQSECPGPRPPSLAFSVMLRKTCLPSATCRLLPGGLKAPSLLFLEW